MKSFLGIDYGTSKTGLAYSVGSFCFAWKTVRTKDLLNLLPEICKEKNIEKIIIGMPYNIDGSMSSHGRKVEKWIKLAETKINIPIVHHDERLTSSEASLGFIEDGYEDWDIDSEAARLILEDYLKNVS